MCQRCYFFQGNARQLLPQNTSLLSGGVWGGLGAGHLKLRFREIKVATVPRYSSVSRCQLYIQQSFRSTLYQFVSINTSSMVELDVLSDLLQKIDFPVESKGTPSSPATVLVDTSALLIKCLKDLGSASVIAVDLEGVDLCHKGCISLLQAYAKGSCTLWVIDVTVLKKSAFELPDGGNGMSLKEVLEAGSIRKVSSIVVNIMALIADFQNLIQLFYDCRNDCDALFHLFNVDCAGENSHFCSRPGRQLTCLQKLPGVYDVQLQELAMRESQNRGRRSIRLLHGLKKAIEENVPHSRAAILVKQSGIKLFSPGQGGSYQVFERRPLAQAILEYAASDVAIMFNLTSHLNVPVGTEARVLRESAKRVASVKSPRYVTHGSSKAEAPTSNGLGCACITFYIETLDIQDLSI